MPEPGRTAGKHRINAKPHAERLAFIRHCRGLDMALDEIRVLLRFRDASHNNCGEVNALLDEHISQVTLRIQDVEGIRARPQIIAQPVWSITRSQGLRHSAWVVAPSAAVVASAACRRHARPNTRKSSGRTLQPVNRAEGALGGGCKPRVFFPTHLLGRAQDKMMVMRLSRTLNKLICHVLVGVFLFAQLAVSGYACPLFGKPTPQEIELHALGAMPVDCDQLDQKAPTLCAEHCKASQQSRDTAPLPVVMAPALSVLYVLPDRAQAVEAAAAPDASSDPLLAATLPPHAILHCVFRL